MAFFGRQATPIVEAALAAKERHTGAPPKLKPHIDCDVMDDAVIAEYISVAQEIGIDPQDMEVERFRVFLAKHDIPTFNLKEVVGYMDELVKKDNPTGLGWHWCPVRAKDAEMAAMRWGRPSEDRREWGRATTGQQPAGELIAASDFYQSHRFPARHGGTWVVPSNASPGWAPPGPIDWREMPSAAYTRTLPLHALKKIALIEREFGVGKAAFLVTDYTTQPHVVVNPDPFLMAVIPNSAVAHGKGRFVIDVWDEPGFGIAQMVR